MDSAPRFASTRKVFRPCLDGGLAGIARHDAIFILETLGEIGRRREAHAISNLADRLVGLDEQQTSLIQSSPSEQVNRSGSGERLHLTIKLNTAQSQFGSNGLNAQVAVVHALFNHLLETGDEGILGGGG